MWWHSLLHTLGFHLEDWFLVLIVWLFLYFVGCRFLYIFLDVLLQLFVLTLLYISNETCILSRTLNPLRNYFWWPVSGSESSICIKRLNYFVKAWDELLIFLEFQSPRSSQRYPLLHILIKVVVWFLFLIDQFRQIFGKENLTSKFTFVVCHNKVIRKKNFALSEIFEYPTMVRGDNFSLEFFLQDKPQFFGKFLSVEKRNLELRLSFRRGVIFVGVGLCQIAKFSGFYIWDY